ncbi:MAG: hypothetical protein IPL40_12575 [Proteobacteria bacterium]|nr:hypothetical protein [Pseudomonadota bacterium]
MSSVSSEYEHVEAETALAADQQAFSAAIHGMASNMSFVKRTLLVEARLPHAAVSETSFGQLVLVSWVADQFTPFAKQFRERLVACFPQLTARLAARLAPEASEMGLLWQAFNAGPGGPGKPRRPALAVFASSKTRVEVLEVHAAWPPG